MTAEVLTVKEVAEELRVHPYTVYQLLSSGELEGFKLTTHWRIKRESLTNFMNKTGARQDNV